MLTRSRTASAPGMPRLVETASTLLAIVVSAQSWDLLSSGNVFRTVATIASSYKDMTLAQVRSKQVYWAKAIAGCFKE